jgi:hypothetical protein
VQQGTLGGGGHFLLEADKNCVGNLGKEFIQPKTWKAEQVDQR